jgi:hypothetical protein
MPKLTRKERTSLMNLKVVTKNRRRFHLAQNCPPMTMSHFSRAEMNIPYPKPLPDFANSFSVFRQVPPISEPVHLQQLLEKLPPHSNCDS